MKKQMRLGGLTGMPVKIVVLAMMMWLAGCGAAGIDRFALVSRHNVVVSEPDCLSPLSVGNGKFAFTADVTGLQSFAGFYEKGTPLATMSDWGWHTFANPHKYSLAETYRYYDTHGRQVAYPRDRDCAAGIWLRENPHRLDLGRVGLKLTKADGTAMGLEELTDIHQTLDLWRGILISRFKADGQSVEVQTCSHSEKDMIAVRIISPLISSGQLQLEIKFPYGSGNWGPCAADWSQSELHQSTVSRPTAGRVDIHRKLDDDEYYVSLATTPAGGFKETARHGYTIIPVSQEGRFEFVCEFSPEPVGGSLPTVTQTQSTCRRYWEQFWSNGGAIDLSGSTDSRAHELERLIVLSQYLTAIQCAGTMPPQESGLTCNSWYGKFHLEMHGWHSVHFALWGRIELLERSMAWYARILPQARKVAREQGYSGARWPKMVGPDGREGPSLIGPFRVTQQGNPVYLAELCYRTKPTGETLDKYKEIVFESAEFMRSFMFWDEDRRCYVLGPPLVSGMEFPYEHPEKYQNPLVELSYWAYGLETAQKWRERLGLSRQESWDHILDNLSPLPVEDGLYMDTETVPNTFSHGGRPAMLEALGWMPGTIVDHEIMRRTLHKVMETLEQWQLWGTDGPMIAMTAARLGEPELAIKALLMNIQGADGHKLYLANGNSYMGANLPVYLPGNGGLLAAVAMMAAGWDGCPNRDAPGFPEDGGWVVKWQGLHKMP